MAQPSVDLVSLRFGRERGRLPPIGALSVAGLVERAGCNWTLLDTQHAPDIHAYAVDALTARLEQLDAEVLGFSLFNDALPVVVSALQRARLRARRVVLGGPGVVGLERKLHELVPSLQAAVAGPAELAFREVVLGRSSQLRVLNHDQQREAQHSEALRVPWSWCEGRGYTLVPLWTARGCPFACQFCDVERTTGRKVIRRDLETSLDELERALCAIDSRQVLLLDDTFTLNRTRALDFAARLSRRHLAVEWELFARPDLIDEPLIEQLAAAGARRLSVGIDAGHDELLARVTKNLCVEKAEAAILRAARHLQVCVHIVWGYPFETLEHFCGTLALCQRLIDSGVMPQLHLLQPAVGTPLFSQYGGRLLSFRPHDVVQVPPRHPVRQLLSREPLLAAPFCSYDTPSFSHKLRLYERFYAAGSAQAAQLRAAS